MVGGIFILILFILVVSAICSSDGSSSNTATKRNNTTKKRYTNNYYNVDHYCECPSCGALYYDGYCDECGYPDINQGWLGENY